MTQKPTSADLLTVAFMAPKLSPTWEEYLGLSWQRMARAEGHERAFPPTFYPDCTVGETGLSRAALETLKCVPPEGCLSSYLAEKRGIERSGATSLMQKCIEMGYAEKVKHRDGYTISNFYTLTDKGRAIVEAER